MCSVDGCEDLTEARGLCLKHYERWRRHGDPLREPVRSRGGMSVEERFWSKVNRNGPIPAQRTDLGPCAVWLAGHSNKGRPVFWDLSKGRNVDARVFVYEHHYGALPEGHAPESLCGTLSCVRPEHLVAAPASAAARAAQKAAATLAAKFATRTHCRHGHPLTEDNVYVTPQGHRRCRACVLENIRRYEASLPDRNRGKRTGSDEGTA